MVVIDFHAADRIMNLPGAPRIPISDLPEAEQEKARFVQDLLRKLEQRCEEAEAAISLMDHVRELPYPAQNGAPTKLSNARKHWPFIAAYSVASSIYGFFEDMEYLGKNLNNCPTLLKMADLKSKRAATKNFNQNFPGFKGVRHGGQHRSKLYGTPEQLEQHAPGRIKLINSLMDNQFITSFEGKQVSIMITDETVTKLCEAKELYWDVFRPIDPLAKRLQRMRSRQDNL